MAVINMKAYPKSLTASAQSYVYWDVGYRKLAFNFGCTTQML